MTRSCRVLAVLLISAMGCGGHSVVWRHGGHTVIRDETHTRLQLVQQYGPADKGAEWGPAQSIIRRIDGPTGKVLIENRAWGRSTPQPDVVFGWKGQFVLYDADLVTFRRSANVLVGARAVNPVESALDIRSSASQSAVQHDLRLLSGDEHNDDRSQAARGRLMRCYPTPLVGPVRSDKPFIIYSVDLDRMQFSEIAIPHSADEVDVFDDIVVIKQAQSLNGYSLHAERRWQAQTLAGERLPSYNLPGWLHDGTHRRIASPLFVTTSGSPIDRNSMVIARRASDGSVSWTKDIGDVAPERALALGPYVVFVGRREYPAMLQHQPASRYEAHWWVWDQAGKEIANGAEPPWKPEYAFRGGAAATRVGVAFDAERSTLIVGAGLDAFLIRDGYVIRRLSDIPGEPLILDDDVLVCWGENSHFAIRLGSLP